MHKTHLKLLISRIDEVTHIPLAHIQQEPKQHFGAFLNSFPSPSLSFVQWQHSGKLQYKCLKVQMSLLQSKTWKINTDNPSVSKTFVFHFTFVGAVNKTDNVVFRLH